MTKGAWKKRITQSCKDAGTYQPFFDDVINSLADILDKRDAAAKQYKEEGSEPIVDYTNKGGKTNPTRNPLLALWDELNKTALTYWRELGLTPSGYKKIIGEKPKDESLSGLAAALAEIES